MIHQILAVLQGTTDWQDYRKYGLWAIPTLSDIAVFFTTFIEIWGFWKQNKTIWNERSGESVSVTLFNYTIWFYLFCGIYGIYINSAVAAFSGILTAFIQIPIIVGLLRFKKFTRREKIAALLFPLMPVLLICVPTKWKGLLFIFFCLSVAIAFGTQPREFLKTKTTGAFDIRLFLVYVFTTTVWMFFVFAKHDIPLEISQTLSSVMITLTIAMWAWYRAIEPNPPWLLGIIVLVRRKRYYPSHERLRRWK